MTAAGVLNIVAFFLSIIFFVLVIRSVVLARRGALKDPARRPQLRRVNVAAGALGVTLGVLILVGFALDLASGATTVGRSWQRLAVGLVFTLANAATLNRWKGLEP